MDMGHWIGISISYGLHAIALYMYVKGLQWAHRNVVDIFGSVGKFLPWILLCLALLRRSHYHNDPSLFRDAHLSILVEHAAVGDPVVTDIHCFPHGLAGMGDGEPVSCWLSCSQSPLFLFSVLAFKMWIGIAPIIDPGQSFHFLAKPDFLVSLFVYAGGFFSWGCYRHLYRSAPKMMLGCLLLFPMFLLSVYLPLLTFGHATAELYEFPMLMTIDTVNITWLLFDRITIFFY